MSLGSFWPEFTYVVPRVELVFTCASPLYDPRSIPEMNNDPKMRLSLSLSRSVCLSVCPTNTSSLKQMRNEWYTKRRRTKCEIKLSKWKPTLTIFISLCRSQSLCLRVSSSLRLPTSLHLWLFVSPTRSSCSHEYCLKTSIIHLLCLHIECPRHEISSSLSLRTRLQLQLSRLQSSPFAWEQLHCVLNLERGFVRGAYAN